MSDVFISYAREDMPKAKLLAEALIADGLSFSGGGSRGGKYVAERRCRLVCRCAAHPDLDML